MYYSYEPKEVVLKVYHKTAVIRRLTLKDGHMGSYSHFLEHKRATRNPILNS